MFFFHIQTALLSTLSISQMKNTGNSPASVQRKFSCHQTCPEGRSACLRRNQQTSAKKKWCENNTFISSVDGFIRDLFSLLESFHIIRLFLKVTLIVCLRRNQQTSAKKERRKYNTFISSVDGLIRVSVCFLLCFFISEFSYYQTCPDVIYILVILVVLCFCFSLLCLDIFKLGCESVNEFQYHICKKKKKKCRV